VFGACGVHGKMRMKVWFEKLKKRDNLEDLGLEERLILKQI
jgi:hypothetical protein